MGRPKKIENVDPSTLDPHDLAFIFKNMQCTEPANKLLAKWLLYMLDVYPSDLKFLHRTGQEYVAHGGCGVYTYARWSAQLKRNCEKFLKG